MADKPFNDLLPAEVERLALLAEECAEVIRIVGKILRHGYNSSDPTGRETGENFALLEKELGHVRAAEEIMLKENDINLGRILRHAKTKLETVGQWLHHQKIA